MCTRYECLRFVVTCCCVVVTIFYRFFFTHAHLHFRLAWLNCCTAGSGRQLLHWFCTFCCPLLITYGFALIIRTMNSNTNGQLVWRRFGSFNGHVSGGSGVEELTININFDLCSFTRLLLSVQTIGIATERSGILRQLGMGQRATCLQVNGKNPHRTTIEM